MQKIHFYFYVGNWRLINFKATPNIQYFLSKNAQLNWFFRLLWFKYLADNIWRL